ncbi:hypothetical protein ACFVAV_14500 [Nocardia sp. NPDC057663]|uniref:hypothetical protein n=1 Tax=Nocardia sp. NPDC057663 TaxID=3346201 RepID=UPI00366AE5F4
MDPAYRTRGTAHHSQAKTGALATAPGGGPGAPLPPGQHPPPGAPPAPQSPPPVDPAKLAELNAQIEAMRVALERLQQQLNELGIPGR